MKSTITVVYKIGIRSPTGGRLVPGKEPARWKEEAMIRIRSGVDLSNHSLDPYPVVLGGHHSFYVVDFSIKSMKVKGTK